MVNISNLFGAVVAILATATEATKVHTKWGCIIVNDKPTCAYHLSPVRVHGDVIIQACIDKHKGVSTCAFNGTIPETWNNAWWSYDNCLMSSGIFLSGELNLSAQKVGCAETTEPVPIENPY